MSISPLKDLIKEQDKLQDYFKSILSPEDYKILNELVEINLEIETKINE
jgi:hypothetical protein